MADVQRRMPAPERRKAILSEARSAFLEAGRGAQGVSTRAIAVRCGIDEALIYRHFGTKDNLYFEAITAPMHEVVSRFAERIESIAVRTAPEEQVRREWELTQQYFLWLLDVPADVLRAVGILITGDTDRAAAFFGQTIAPTLERLEGLVEDEHPTWDHVDFNVSLAVRTVLATSFWLVIESEITARSLDAPTVARDLANLLFYGMAKR